MEQNTFTYQYSAERNKEVEFIRKKYLPQEESKLDRLKKLDQKVQSAGVIEALCLGIIGALVFGVGLCFGLDVFGGFRWLAGLFCALGIVMMIPAYPLCKRQARKVRKALTPEILRLSEEIMKS
ncbi:MAG: hypothetical protein IKA76_04115 [Clostridia bacterium]|nr:hypothetical protein [Clostridia bacterium]